ncbi:WD40 repeat-like protein [Daldinia bambusicola]|nr:WD40 repeat-like protein [Daldinia bambusicola]
MAQSDIEPFQRALNRFKQSLTPDLVNEFAISSLTDVKKVCTEVQQKHGCSGKLRHMGRVRGFIEAMEQLGKVIEVFLNASELVCFLWTANTHINSFDKLLDAYAQVGDAIPGLQRYEATFKKHPPLATVLEDYYSDILEFHRIALGVFKRPRWKDMYHSVWKTFDSNLSPILQSLCKRRELLESEKGSATLYEIQQLRKELSDLHTKYRKQIDEEHFQRHKARVSQVRERLNAPSYEIDQEMAAENILIDSSGKWLFESCDFQAWYTDGSGHRILYLNGIPGAGKTTLISRVVRKLLDERSPTTLNRSVVYFYFKHQQPTKQSHNSLLRSILDQLINQDSAISDHLFNKISAIDPTSLRLTSTLEGFVKEALGSYQTTYIVIDGLDESASKEAARSVEWFLSLVNGSLDTTTTASLRILFCGQRDGVLDRLLADEPFITLENTHHAEDIKSYCSQICERIAKKFNISRQLEEEIIQRVTEGAKGMFLYARVVLDNLLSQTRLSGLKAEIKPDTFPKGIEKAYERVAVRVFNDSSPSEREDAKRILGWITCAGRLLRWREIQSSFCISPKKGIAEYEEGKLRVTCKELCRSLIDVHSEGGKKDDPDDIVKIVHETAREYLIRNGWIDVDLVHTTLAIFCSTYLTSEPFRCDCDEKTIYGHAVTGYYALQDYAVQYWFHHFKKCIKISRKLDIVLWQEVASSARDFLGSYSILVDIGKHDKGDNEGVVDALMNLPEDDMERNTHFNIELRTIRIRKVLESIQSENLEDMTREILTNLHGTTKRYKCWKPWCELFTTGYEEVEDREQHLNLHDLPFRCTFEDCPAHSFGFDTPSKLEQHVGRHHQEASNELEFPKVRPKKGPTLYQAIIQGDIATIQGFLDAGINIKNPPTWKPLKGRPLHAAIEYDQIEICKLLLENGAEINYGSDGQGETPLHTAVKRENLEIVQFLLRQEHCLLDEVDRTGVSPFQYACREGNLALVKMLFETGKIDVNRRKPPDSIRESKALRFAIRRGHFGVVQYLLAETQVGPVTKDDLLAAVVRGHKSIFNILLPAIAIPSQDNFTASPYTTGFPPSCVILGSDWFVIRNQYAPNCLSSINLVNTFHIPMKLGATHIIFSHCGKYVIFYTKPSVIEVCDVISMNQVGRYEIDRHPIRAFLSSDGRRLVILTENGIHIWDGTSRRLDFDLQVYGDVQSLGNPLKSVYFAADGSLLVACVALYNTIRLLGVKNGKRYYEATRSVENWVEVAEISPNGRYVVTGSGHGIIHVWGINACNLLAHWEPEKDKEAPIKDILFHPNNENIIGCRTKESIQFYQLSESTSYGGMWKIEKINGSDGMECPLTFDSDWLLLRFEDGGVQFWDTRNNVSHLLLLLSEDKYIATAMSSTQALFATHDGSEVRLWSYTSKVGD